MKSLLLVLALLMPIERVDHELQAMVQAHRGGWPEAPMRAATDIGKPVVVLGALLGIAVLDTAEGVAMVRVALVTLAVANVLVEGLKRLTGRVRPDGESKRSNSSLPSSHAANAFALALLFARRWPRGAVAFWAGAVVIAWSRVYLNRHFVSDVIVGAALGAGSAYLVARTMHWRAAAPRVVGVREAGSPLGRN